MEVKCCICGKKTSISKIHQAYAKLAKNPKGTFICDFCQQRIQGEHITQWKKQS